MPTSIPMPRLGESVTEGTVTRWLKAIGDQVALDEPLLEVSTDKVDTEVTSPVAGVLLSITVAEDEIAEIGSELATIGELESDLTPAAAGPETPAALELPPSPGPPVTIAAPPAPAPAPEPQAALPRTPPATVNDVSASAASLPGSDTSMRELLTPLVRKLAAEHGVDLSNVQGSGVGGRIRKADVETAVQNSSSGLSPVEDTTVPLAVAPTPASPQAAAPDATVAASASAEAGARGRTETMTRLRQVIARRMVESLQTSAQLTTVVEVDVTRIARLRDRAKLSFQAIEGVKLSFLPFFAVAAIEALNAHPVVNASVNIEAKTITYHEGAHLGIAVDSERGLLVPVIRDAGDLNLGAIARKIADLAERTRANKIGPDELSGATFTLTNTGSRGALFDTPILNQPQVGILGTGAVVKRPVVIEDANLGETIAVRSMVYLALSYDHRIVDGADAARFLATMKGRLEAGAFERALGL